MLNLWANFFAQEKLTAKALGLEGTQVLLDLATELAKRGVRPARKPYRFRVISRQLVVVAAMDLGIDLMGLTKVYDGKVAMGRGMIDVWHAVYADRFGSNYGTASWAELRRRKVVTKLSEQRRACASSQD